MPAELRPAATVILLRDSAAGPEVWLMERARTVGFMPSAWVFPGGRVDPADADLPVAGLPRSEIPRAFWAAAARELEEEAAVRLGGERYEVGGLVPWSRWQTPEFEPRRYDTWFFAARLPEGAEARIDGGEAVDGVWITVATALERLAEGRLPLAPPTLRTLHEIGAFPSVAAILAAPRRLVPICPTFVTGPADTLFVLLPGDPEHPSPDRVDPPFRYAFDAGRWRAPP